MSRHLSLVLGGARSGKSRFAEALVMEYPGPWGYLATAQAFDEEMTARIADHAARRGTKWRTVEAPLDLAGAVRDLAPDQVALIDCITLWLSNHLLAGSDLAAETAALCSALQARTGPTVVVSNEVGLGIVPDNALARRFRDAAGVLNQQISALAGHVVFVAAGLPLTLKGPHSRTGTE